MADWTKSLDIAVTEHRWRDVDEILRLYNDVISFYSIHRAIEACIQNIQAANDSYSIEGIIGHCEREQLDRVLNIALTEGWWLTVIKVLEKGVPGLQQKKVVVDTFIENATKHVLYTTVIPHCDSKQLNRMLNRAVTEGSWFTVICVLRAGVLDRQQRKKAVDKFIENESDYELYPSIILHCDREQLYRVLNRAVTEGWWHIVIKVLKKGVGAESKHTAVDVFIAKASKEWDSSYIYIMQHCDREQQDRLLNTALTEGWWSTVIELLKLGVHGEQQKKTIVDTFIDNATRESYADIIHHCDSEKLNRVLNRALTEGWWSIVIKVLVEDVHSKQERKVAVDKFIKVATKDYYTHIIPHCDTEQLDRALNRAVTEGWWDTVIGMLKTRAFGEEQMKVAIDQCIEKATWHDYTYTDIIRYCDREQQKRVLNRTVKKKWWDIVISQLLLDDYLHDEQTKVAVDEIIEHAVWYFFENALIIQHCNREQLHRILNRAITNGLWDIAINMLNILSLDIGSFEKEQVKVAIDEFIESMEDCDYYGEFDNYARIIQHCDREQQERALYRAVTDEWWCTVIKVLETGVFDKQQIKVAVDKFIENATKDNYTDIIPHCDREQLHRALNRALTEGWWTTVIKALEKSVLFKQQRNLAFDNFIENAPGGSYAGIIPHCDREQLERVLRRALTEGWWSTVLKGLEESVLDKQQRNLAIDTFIENAPEGSYVGIIPYCDRKQLESVLNRALTEGWWSTVIKVLEKGVYDKEQRKVVFDTFIENAAFIFYGDIILHCDKEQLNRLLNRALTEASWDTVMEVLNKGVHDTEQKKAAVDTLLKNESEYHYVGIIPHCDREQLNRVLNIALTEGWWSTVIKGLEKGVHDKQRKKKVVDTFIEHATGAVYDIIPHCDREQLNRVLKRAVTNGCWHIVFYVLDKGVSAESKHAAVDVFIDKASEHSLEQTSISLYENWHYLDIMQHCDKEQQDRVMNRALSEGWWYTVIRGLKKNVHDKHQMKIVVDKFIENAPMKSYGSIIPHCDREQLNRVLNRALANGWWDIGTKVLMKGLYGIQRRKVEVDTLIENATKTNYTFIVLHCDTEQLERALNRALTEGWFDIVEMVIEKGVVITTLHTWTAVTYRIIQKKNLRDSSETMKLFNPQNTYTYLFPSVNRCQFSEDHNTLALMISLEELRITHSLVPLTVNLSDFSKEIQSVCVMILMKEDRWDEISKVCLCHVWEQVGRELLQEAVDQRRWSIVQQWADHTVYDDQRWWAVKEAYKEKQWRVMLLLSDHGLTEIELMWVYYRLAMFADWATVGHMLQRGVDVTDLREVVENAMISTKTARDPAKRLALGKRWQRLKALEQKMSNVSSRQAYKAAKSCQWNVVMPSLHYQYGKIRHELIQITLKVALEHRAWHVVLQLIKLDMEQAQRDSLFTDMVRQQQWGVCRALLDHGVSVHLCLDVLPQLMQEDQWLLVARMMENDLDDAKRREVMQRAMERRQGSVVWRCISTMQHYRLSEEEREQLFHQAISRCVLQAVKPLIEEKDPTGLRHRDGALLAGIELRQWDVVDYCQEQRADINMKNEQGETPLNRAARKKDWKTVKALVVRGGDTNILDKDGVSLLHRTIRAKQMDLTKLVIEYHGDIHKETYHVTPLQSLINGRYGDAIHHTLMWCPDQAKGVNEKGETTLHAIALDNRPELMYHQVVRGVNPLNVTKDGKSVLLYAVMNKHCAQRMVAECIRLGFSTHQPALTKARPLGKSLYDIEQTTSSPLLLAVTKARFTLAHMLYEAGSSSYSQLFHMFTDFLELSNPLTERPQTLSDQREINQYNDMVETFTIFLPDLSKMATTVRSLISTCRLVISHCLNVHRRYESDVYQLRLTDRMRNYILFSDLTDPDYERCLHGTITPLKPQ